MNVLESLYRGADSAESYASNYLDHMAKITKTIPSDRLPTLIDWMEEAANEDNTIFVVGNGGSGAVASHWVNDLGPNSVVAGKPGYRVMSLTENGGSLTAIGNDASFDEVFEIQLKTFMRPGDVVIALSVSGNSPNIIRAVEYANANGARTVGCSGIEGGKLSEIANHSIVIPSSNDEYGPVEDAFSIIMHISTTYLTMKKGRMLAH
jgi:D-sedoheptulose 7-phosphate isomerase